MTEATIALALTDYVPVVLSAVGLLAIAGVLERRGTLARTGLRVGVALVVGGGLAKATGKLVLALTDRDVVVLNQALFPLLAPGMLLLAIAASRGAARRPRPTSTAAAVGVPLTVWALAAGVAATVSLDAAKAVLIVVASAGNVALYVVLARAAARDGARVGATLLVTSLSIVLLLASMSRTLESTIAVQWTEQSLNALAQGLLVVAAQVWTRAAEDLGLARASTAGEASAA